MKTSKITSAGSLLTLAVLPSLVSSIFFDPFNNRQTSPEVKVVIETMQQAGAGGASLPEAATAQQEIVVPLTTYSDFKGKWHSRKDTDSIVKMPLSGSYGNIDIDDITREPLVMVTISGEQEFRPVRISRVVEIIPPQNAQDVFCGLVTETNERFSYTEPPAEEEIAKVRCSAFYYNENYFQQYKAWIHSGEAADINPKF